MQDTASVISLDIGGTTSKGFAINWKDKSVVRFQLPSRNLRSLVELELAEFLHLVLQSLPHPAMKNRALWCIGAAGARPAFDGERITQLLKDLGAEEPDVQIFPDFCGNWAAAFGGEDGLISVNGTGSVLFGRHQSQEKRRGGFGHLLDESPSGACFGRYFLRELLVEIEDQPGPLAAVFAGHHHDSHPTRDDLLNQLYSHPWPQSFLAGYSECFAEAWRKGHPGAGEAFRHSLTTLEKQIKALLNDLGNPVRIKFTGIGGIWQNCPDLGAVMHKHLAGAFARQLEPVSPSLPLHIGPFLYYLVRKGLQPALVIPPEMLNNLTQ